MAAPPRRARPRSDNRTWVSIGAQAGDAHSVRELAAARGRRQPRRAERVSISFNYGWF